MSQVHENPTRDSAWRSLYLIGAAAALIAVTIFRRNCGAEFVAFKGFGVFNTPTVQPVKAIDWFTLLQEDWFVGLVYLDFIDVINYTLVGLIFLALFAALYRTNKSLMLIAIAAALVGIAVYLASNPAYSMLALSQQYAAATSEAQKESILAAGDALLAINNPGAIYRSTGHYSSLLLVTLAGLLISIVMLQSKIFNKATAYVGLLANTILLGHFFVLACAPKYIALPTVISAPFRVGWYILIALKLFRLGVVDEIKVKE